MVLCQFQSHCHQGQSGPYSALVHFNFFFGGGGDWGGRLFEAGGLLTFSTFRVGAYLSRGLFEVGR